MPPFSSLPPILPIARPGGMGMSSLPGRGLGTTPPRAQNFSVSKLQQTRDLEGSRVSMSQAMRLRDATRTAGATSSIFRVGQAANMPTTSINRPAVERDAAGAMQSDAGADDRRYSYVKRLVKERQAKEAAGGDSKSGFGVQTGSQFRGKLLHKQFGKLIRANRATYNTIGSKERAFFEDLLKGHAANKATGAGFHRHDRLSMRMEVEKARQAGQLSYINAQHFKKLIDGLE